MASRIEADYELALNKLCKWRTILAGWIWGTSARDAPGSQGQRDLMDARLVVRAETSAIVALLVEKKFITIDEFAKAVTKEAVELDRTLERTFAGMKSSTTGIVVFDIDIAQKTMNDLGFPK